MSKNHTSPSFSSIFESLETICGKIRFIKISTAKLFHPCFCRAKLELVILHLQSKNALENAKISKNNNLDHSPQFLGALKLFGEILKNHQVFS